MGKSIIGNAKEENIVSIIVVIIHVHTITTCFVSGELSNLKMLITRVGISAIMILIPKEITSNALSISATKQQ